MTAPMSNVTRAPPATLAILPAIHGATELFSVNHAERALAKDEADEA